MAKKIQLTKNGEDVYPITVPDSIAGLAQVAKTGSYNDLTNIPGPEVFLITRDVTTYAEIYAAVNAGKVCMMYDGDEVYTVTCCENGEPIHLYTYGKNGISGVEISPEDEWEWVDYYYTDFVIFHAKIGRSTLYQIFYAVNARMLVLGRATEDAMGDELYSLVAISYGNQGYALFSRTDEDGTVYFAKVTKSGNQESWSYSERFIASSLSELSDDSTHRTVTDTEKATWNAKADIFIAQYGSTTYNAIYEAFSDGKVVLVSRTSTGTTRYYQLTLLQSRGNAYFEFTKVQCDDEDGFIDTVRITQSNVWTRNSIEISIPTDLSDLSDDSTHRLVTDAEKSTWNGKYTKPSTGIPASDIASGVIPSYGIADANNLGLVKVDKNAGGINKDSNGKLILDTASNAEIEARTTTCAVKVSQIDKAVKEGVTNNSITLTSAEQTAAKSWLGVNDTPEIFWATYGTTTAAEIDAAVAAGKAVMCRHNNRDYVLAFYDPTNAYIYFGHVYASNLGYVYVTRSTGIWVNGLRTPEQTTNKVSTLSGNESDTTKYPNTKAMADALGKMGVISQTQTWTQAADGGYDYVMSNPVLGLIPQANIDLFERAGATFNAVTGYFEFNGLTDLSYEEMMAVYTVSQPMIERINLQGAFYGRNIRTNICIYHIGTTGPYGSIPMSDLDFRGVCYESGIEVLSLTDSNDVTKTQSKFHTTNNLSLSFATNSPTFAMHLKKVDGVISIKNSSTPLYRAFYRCSSLESVTIYGLNAAIDFAQSPRLTAESIATMINNAGTAAITITLHATAYARATADPAVQEALAAHTNVSLAQA